MAKSYFYDESISDWRELVKGEQGERGPVGPIGPQGPAIDIETGLPISVDTTVGTRVFIDDVMIHGDTGWRDYSEYLTEFWRVGDTGHTRLRIKRKNNSVFLHGRIVYVSQPDVSHSHNSSMKFLEELVEGFRPLWNYLPLGEVAFYGGELFSGASHQGMAYQVATPSARFPTLNNAWSEGQALGFALTWETDDTWPSELPGTPV